MRSTKSIMRQVQIAYRKLLVSVLFASSYNLNMGYSQNREWSDNFLPLVKQIVGPHLLEPSPYEVDANQCGDLVVVRGKAKTVGVRVREHYAADKWPDQFTIRSRLDSGNKTELAKIINGWGDVFFYGFADENEQGFAGWYLIDMDVFRKALMYPERRDSIRTGEKCNGDGTYFRWFKVSDFPDALLIDSSPPQKKSRELERA